NRGFEDSEGNFWKVDLCVSFDWKFMTLVLGINSPTSHYFSIDINKSIETVDLIKDLLDCISNADSLELPNLSEAIAKIEIGNSKSKESELEVSNTKDLELEIINEKKPNT
ncbi:11979_t:CDS:2, partial [Racocetra fulgida]